MNSEVQPVSGGDAPASGFGLDDVLFTVFRHKILILVFVCLGLVGAVIVRFVKPPLYESQAKISVRFIQEMMGVNTADPEKQIRSTSSGADAIMSSEVDNLKSLDTAKLVATNVGPARILAMVGGGDDLMAAAGSVASGITVDPPRTTTLTVTFRHPDSTIVQPVMEELIRIYKRRHLAMHQGVDVLDQVFQEKRDETAKKLQRTEEELKKLKSQLNIPNLDEAKRSQLDQISKLENELFTVQMELAQRKAAVGDVASTATNSLESSVPSDKAEEYSRVITRLDEVKKLKATMLQDWTPLHPQVEKAEKLLERLMREKMELEQAFPSLANLYLGSGSARGDGTNTVLDLAAELGQIKKLTQTAEALGTMLTNKQGEIMRLMELEPDIVRLELRRSAELKDYNFYLSALEQARTGDSKNSANLVNMYVVQNPSPPRIDMKKMQKFIGAVFGACIALGVGIAFLIDLFFDRTIRNTSDVARHLQMPVFLSIPDAVWPKRKHAPGQNGSAVAHRVKDAKEKPNQNNSMGIAPWSPDHYMQTHIEGLRERVITYFDIHNLNHKPKLVALTACNLGAGVTTLSAGLAAALSRTGEGSVLLVDMNTGQGATHSFYKGKPGCGPSEEVDTKTDAPLSDNLSLTTIKHGADTWERIAKMLPPSFNDLVPKLKASEYDYIIFDMATATPTSVTPRMASHMDIVLMVLECEKTSQQSARRATSLMRESRANMVAVLNKWRNYVPARFSHE